MTLSNTWFTALSMSACLLFGTFPVAQISYKYISYRIYRCLEYDEGSEACKGSAIILTKVSSLDTPEIVILVQSVTKMSSKWPRANDISVSVRIAVHVLLPRSSLCSHGRPPCDSLPLSQPVTVLPSGYVLRHLGLMCRNPGCKTSNPSWTTYHCGPVHVESVGEEYRTAFTLTSLESIGYIILPLSLKRTTESCLTSGWQPSSCYGPLLSP